MIATEHKSETPLPPNTATGTALVFEQLIKKLPLIGSVTNEQYEELGFFAREVHKQLDQARRERDEAKQKAEYHERNAREFHGELFGVRQTNDQLRVRVVELEKSLFSCSSELTDIKDMHRGDLIRARIAEKRVAELEKAIRNHVEASNNDDSAGDSFGVLVEIIKAIDEVMKGQE